MAVHWRVYHYAYRSQYKDRYDTGESQHEREVENLNERDLESLVDEAETLLAEGGGQ
jgi:hypothetical protein